MVKIFLQMATVMRFGMMMHLEVYSISEVAKMEIVGDPNAWPT